MDEKETYGVVVEAKTNLFKKAIQELSGMIKKFGKVAEEETTVTPKIIDNKFTTQIENVKKRMSSLQKEMNEAINIREDTSMETFLKHRIESQEEYLKLLNRNAKIFGSETVAGYGGEEGKTYSEIIDKVTNSLENYKQQLSDVQKKENNKVNQGKIIEYEALKNVLDDLIDKEKQYNLEQEKRTKEEKDFKEQINNTNKSMKDVLDNGINKIKRFTYYLLGARSVFSLFMKYQSIYYQYNEKMQYQSELSQNAIALSLAPAFEFLGNVVAYASIGIAKFIELLTGVNVLSKVTTKGIRDYNKSLKETQTLVNGIDEVTNLTKPGNLGLASQYQALADFQKKVKEVEDWFAKNTWIKKTVEGLQEIYNSIDGVNGLFAIMGAYTFSKLIGKSVVGGTGLLGVKATLLSLTMLPMVFTTGGLLVGLINEGKDLINTYKEAKNEQKNLLTENRNKVDDAITKIADYVNAIDGLDKKTKNYETQKNKYIDKIKKEFEIISLTLMNDRDLYEQNKDYLFTIANKLDELTNSDYYTKLVLNIDANSKKADSVLETFIKKWKIKLKETPLGQAGYDSLLDYQIQQSDFNPNKKRTYAKGLDYVPYDNYPALLHKGEAVVPAKYNPTIHSEGNEYTNSLLETVVMKLDDLSRKPTILNIDGQQFANATYEHYEEARNNQNYVEGVVR